MSHLCTLHHVVKSHLVCSRMNHSCLLELRIDLIDQGCTIFEVSSFIDARAWCLFTSFQVLEKVDVEQKMSIRFLHWRAADSPLDRTLIQGRSCSVGLAAGLSHFDLLGSNHSSSGCHRFVFYVHFFCQIMALNHTRIVVWIKGNNRVPSFVDLVSPVIILFILDNSWFEPSSVIIPCGIVGVAWTFLWAVVVQTRPVACNGIGLSSPI